MTGATARVMRESILRLNSIILFENGLQPPVLELIGIALGPLPVSGPHSGPPFLVNLKHVLGRLTLIKPENLFKNHHHIAHQIDGVIQHNYMPNRIKLILLIGQVLDFGNGQSTQVQVRDIS